MWSGWVAVDVATVTGRTRFGVLSCVVSVGAHFPKTAFPFPVGAYLPTTFVLSPSSAVGSLLLKLSVETK